MGSGSSTPKRDAAWQILIDNFNASPYFQKLTKEAKSLWKKNDHVIYSTLINRRRIKLQERKKALLKARAGEVYKASPDDDPVIADLKKRHQKVSTSLSFGAFRKLCNLITIIEAIQEIEELLLQDGTSEFPQIAAELEEEVNPESIYAKYFGSFDFIKEHLTNRYRKEGKSEEEITQILQVKEAQYLQCDGDSFKFALPVRLLIVRTRIKNSFALQCGRAMSFISGVNLRYGGMHNAIQIGYLVFHWLDDSLVHVEVLSSKSVVAMLYPEYPSKLCFIREISAPNKSKGLLMNIARVVADFNGQKNYNKVSTNCQYFASEVFKAACKSTKWLDSGPIDLFVKNLAKGGQKAPFHFWAFNKTTSTLTEVQCENFAAFAKWCKDNEVHEMQHSAKNRASNGGLTMENETFELCKALWRAKQLQQQSGGLQSSKIGEAKVEDVENIVALLDSYFNIEQLGVLRDNSITVGQLVEL